MPRTVEYANCALASGWTVAGERS